LCTIRATISRSTKRSAKRSGGSTDTWVHAAESGPSLRANTVFRWEFKPGSTLYVVWTQQREEETTDGRLAFNQDISRMMRAPGDNVFMVKMSYWFGR
jgi:hypothetical protein